MLQPPAASSAPVLPPGFLPPNPKCSNGSIGLPDPLPPSDDRDWGEAHLADALLRRWLLPPFSNPAFPSAFPPLPPALPSYPAAPGPATSPASMAVHSSFQNCYASSRSISLAVVIAPSSALITGSLTPSVIGDRPHPIYGEALSSVVVCECRCSKIMSPPNCNETLSPYQDGDDESERVPTGESD